MEDDDDEEEEFKTLYEDGHWEWDEYEKTLRFKSDLPPVIEEVKVLRKKAPTGTIEFKDDIDLMEQVRFRRRYQRQDDSPNAVVTLQDCKDLALYTAPVSILSRTLINILHCPTTERFLRALIMYCQVYLQVDKVMKFRMEELNTKLRTPMCLKTEAGMRTDLADLRVLVAKEYCTFIVGGADLRKFHHMGYNKKSKSLSDRDARLIETLLRVFVQIIWLALSRKSFNQIELEVHRIFKSELFNVIEHRLKTGTIKKMKPEEKLTLLGKCNKISTKLYQQSPLYNEIFCHDTGFRLTGLGVTGFAEMTPRLEYIEATVSAPEATFPDNGIVLGIIGQLRNRYDTMLNELKVDPTNKDASGQSSQFRGKSSYIKKNKSKSASTSSKSKASMKKGMEEPPYPDIILPDRSPETYFPPTYPNLPPTYPIIPHPNRKQQKKWIKRFEKLTGYKKPM